MTAAEIVKQHPCPVEFGRHEWIWYAACLCHESGVQEAEAETAIRDGLTRDETPGEVTAAVSAAYARAEGGDKAQTAVLLDGKRVFKKDLVYSLDTLQKAVAGVPAITRDWLRERSPVWAFDALSFLGLLYRPDESVLVFDRMDSRIPALKVRGAGCFEWKKRQWVEVERESVVAGLASVRFPNGVWFLAQPVTGDWTEGEKPTCRSRENVTAFRWLVLESDQAPEGEWLRLLVTLPGVAAIYTSGGKSIHALLRLDSESKMAFDSTVQKHKPRLITLGADPAAMTAVRLTRLPWCWRGAKRQELLYLNPNAVPGGKAICGI